ncbi:MAG: type II toxin-antitoxin system RelE/ParE family toxin [Candidatus Kapabacteria bacterium]|nr:type II toxin-antitoxin system RelE/ParE family toxin [Candidatus Kapabacteria bacterium]
MNYKVKTLANFEKKAKKLIRKYPSLVQEISELISDLRTNPKQGIDLGKNCYKIRLAIESKGKGKSGGGRVITHVYVAAETVYMLSIFDKSEQSDISENEIFKLLEKIKLD